MDFKKEFRNIKKYFSDQEKKIRESQVKQFTFFVLGFVLFYLILTGLVGFFPSIFFKTIVGVPSEILLNVQGVETTSLIEEDFVINITSNGTRIIISDLCAGTMEIIILISAILASFGVAWEKKWKGILIGIVTGYVFNIFRIWITVNIILTQSIEVADFAHDTLFRIILFVYITGFYVAWFYWSENGLPKIIKNVIKKIE
jgi:exosortase/archaeosortase family protein